jgi:hypothetical protein
VVRKLPAEHPAVTEDSAVVVVAVVDSAAEAGDAEAAVDPAEAAAAADAQVDVDRAIAAAMRPSSATGLTATPIASPDRCSTLSATRF